MADKEERGEGPSQAIWSFQRINGSRAHEEVVDQITFAIRTGAFARGERLPHFDDLAREMGVSKPTIGEAIKILTEAGVLSAQRGVNGGITVVDDVVPPDVMALGSTMTPATLREIVEARRPVEMELALLAGKRATEEQFRSIGRSIDLLRQFADSHYSLRIHYDHMFHYAMARAANSAMLSFYQHQILERLYIAMKEYFVTYEDVNSVILLHVDTLMALKSRDRDAIVDAIDRHLRPLEKHVFG